MKEVELKFLDINVEDVKGKLEKLGAELKYDTYIESYPFISDEFHGYNSDKKYLRVRKVDDDVEITYKDPAITSDMTAREEINLRVDSYEEAIKLIEKLGFEKGEVFRKHRVHYELGSIHFELDTLDHIPTYLEIETETEDEMKKVCVELELDILHGKKGTIVEIFPEKFRG